MKLTARNKSPRIPLPIFVVFIAQITTRIHTHIHEPKRKKKKKTETQTRSLNVGRGIGIISRSIRGIGIDDTTLPQFSHAVPNADHIGRVNMVRTRQRRSKLGHSSGLILAHAHAKACKHTAKLRDGHAPPGVAVEHLEDLGVRDARGAGLLVQREEAHEVVEGERGWHGPRRRRVARDAQHGLQRLAGRRVVAQHVQDVRELGELDGAVVVRVEHVEQLPEVVHRGCPVGCGRCSVARRLKRRRGAGGPLRC